MTINFNNEVSGVVASFSCVSPGKCACACFSAMASHPSTQFTWRRAWHSHGGNRFVVDRVVKCRRRILHLPTEISNYSRLLLVGCFAAALKLAFET